MSQRHDQLAIVSAADENFFPLLSQLLASISAALPSGVPPPEFCVIDLGLTDAQKSELRSREVTVAAGQWPFDFPGRAEAPRWMQAMAGRPFLPQYFPGREIYLWLDSDTWLQDWRIVDLAV